VAVTKERIAIRLSRDVIEAFRATGEGWRMHMGEALPTLRRLTTVKWDD
jgi:uncharacterized protein (DUF4415 family)